MYNRNSLHQVPKLSRKPYKLYSNNLEYVEYRFVYFYIIYSVIKQMSKIVY
jgi:hypothetical protein